MPTNCPVDTDVPSKIAAAYQHNLCLTYDRALCHNLEGAIARMMPSDKLLI